MNIIHTSVFNNLKDKFPKYRNLTLELITDLSLLSGKHKDKNIFEFSNQDYIIFKYINNNLSDKLSVLEQNKSIFNDTNDTNTDETNDTNNTNTDETNINTNTDETNIDTNTDTTSINTDADETGTDTNTDETNTDKKKDKKKGGKKDEIILNKLLVIVIHSSKLKTDSWPTKIANIKHILDKLKDNDISDLIVVTQTKISVNNYSSLYRNIINTDQTYNIKSITNYSFYNLAIVLPESPICNDARILPIEEINVLRESNHIILGDMALMYTDDPLNVWIGAKATDVIEFTRVLDGGGESLYYRYVVRPFL